MRTTSWGIGRLARTVMVAGALAACGGGGSGSADAGGAAANAGYTLEEALEVAIRFSACSGEDDFRGFVDTAAWAGHQGGYGGYLATLFTCVRGAADCRAVLACEGLDADRSCAGADPGRVCVGESSARTCESLPDGRELERTLSCNDSGMEAGARCLVDDGGQVSCGFGTCEASEERCDGNVLVLCNEGVAQRFDCRSVGETGTCGQAPWGELGCYLPPGTCTQSACEGNVLAVCDGEGSVSGRVDCAWFGGGFACLQRTDGDAPTCALSESDVECSASTPAVCDGAKLRLCLFGRWRELDCATFLAGTCGPVGSGHTGGRGEGVRCLVP